MTGMIKKLAIILSVAIVVLLVTVFASETIFGDLSNTESLKPLWVIIPVMLGVGGFIYYKTK